MQTMVWEAWAVNAQPKRRQCDNALFERCEMRLLDGVHAQDRTQLRADDFVDLCAELGVRLALRSAVPDALELSIRMKELIFIEGLRGAVGLALHAMLVGSPKHVVLFKYGCLIFIW